ncbi:type III-A CRISPR-associated RAMP protein Csm5 [Dissulfurispira thermophila]|uniref:CRISPR system Cms protein Csm5 n=1 Tax=Dissulfurispira thermophila TaxID=2715679 RepID=A0A7G1H1A6_9BACT|nr:type III-A CRISPR-associated RAMP protein Csm5 [Dissulfurispira thermophila]BCB96600.1 type III-A CRISPR-associated RAMP protein Csm5 [Dissulfurispira thermophila]
MSVYETKRIKLTTKSPIHIGSVDQRITRFEFIHQGQYIYPISEDRLSGFLQKKNLVSHYVSSVERDGSRFNLADFFKNKAVTLNASDLENLSNKRKIKVMADASRMQDFKPFIRDGFGLPYIPGTSIKGVIRTALLYNILKRFKQNNDSEFQRVIEARISQDIDADYRKKNKKELFQWANKRWLEGFILERKQRDNQQMKTRCPNTDWLRMLHVSDAYTSNNIETVLIPANILKKENTWTYKKEDSGQNTTIWIECIPENTVFEFEVAWDKRLLDDFKRYNESINLPDSLSAVFNDVNNWASDALNFEKDFSRGNDLENWYKNNTPNFRIGFGSGMVFTTIIMLLNEDLRKKIRNYAGLNRDNDIAPKSRRVWLKNNMPVPFGWAVIGVQ